MKTQSAIYRWHSLTSDHSPQLKFQADDRHWWILKRLGTNEQGQVSQLLGQFSKESHEEKTFAPSQVLNASETITEVRILERDLRGGPDDDDNSLYVPGFAAGHKPSCPKALPEFRDPETRADFRERLRKVLGKKRSDAQTLEVKALECNCGASIG